MLSIPSHGEVKFISASQQHSLPIDFGHADFHSRSNLVAVSGEFGFVAPIEQAITFKAQLSLLLDEQNLMARASGRMTEFRERPMPIRIAIYKGLQKVCFEPEYVRLPQVSPQSESKEFDFNSDNSIWRENLNWAVERCKQTDHPLRIDASKNRRLFSRGFLVPPLNFPADEAMAVSFAHDLVEIWLFKKIKNGEFEQNMYPVYAFKPDLPMVDLIKLIRKHLSC